MAGVLGCRITDYLASGRRSYIDDLFVSPQQRGAGIGHLLLDAARRIAAGACNHLRLCSGRARRGTHSFPESNGFDRFGL